MLHLHQVCLFSCHTVSSSQNQFTWILNTGATDHMICSPFLFYSIVFPRTPSKVHLPNVKRFQLFLLEMLNFLLILFYTMLFMFHPSMSILFLSLD